MKSDTEVNLSRTCTHLKYFPEEEIMGHLCTKSIWRWSALRGLVSG